MAVEPQAHRGTEVWAPVRVNVSEGPFVYVYCTYVCSVYARTGVHIYVRPRGMCVWAYMALHVCPCSACLCDVHRVPMCVTMSARADVCARVSVCMSLYMQGSKNNCGLSQSLPSTHFPEGEELPRRPRLKPQL